MWLRNQCSVGSQLNNAMNNIRNQIYANLYRSRAAIDPMELRAMFSWLALPVINNPENINVLNNAAILHIDSLALSRGDTVDAVDEVFKLIRYRMGFTLTKTVYRPIIVSSVNNPAAVEILRENLKADGFTPVPEYRAMVTTSVFHEVLIFSKVVENVHYYIFITNKYNVEILYRFSACILAHSNRFNDTAISNALANSLQNGDCAAYNQTINTLYADYESQRARKEMLRKLTTLQEITVSKTINALDTKITRIVDVVKSKYHEIDTLYADQTKLEAQRLLLTTQPSNHLKELTDFMQANINNIAGIDISSDKLYFIYRTELLYFDQAVFAMYKTGREDNPYLSQPNWKRALLDNIFEAKDIRVQIESSASISIDVSAVPYVGYGNYTLDNPVGIPNPHHRYHDCWGNNASLIKQALREGNHTIAIAQIFAAMAAINLTDTTVFRDFVNRQLDTNNGECNNIPFLILSDGTRITTREYRRRYENATNQNVEQTN